MSVCNSCKKTLPAPLRVCPYCGAAQNASPGPETLSAPTTTAVQSPQQKHKNKKAILIIALIILFLLLALIGWLFFSKSSTPTKPDTASGGTAPPIIPTTTSSDAIYLTINNYKSQVWPITIKGEPYVALGEIYVNAFELKTGKRINLLHFLNEDGSRNKDTYDHRLTNIATIDDVCFFLFRYYPDDVEYEDAVSQLYSFSFTDEQVRYWGMFPQMTMTSNNDKLYFLSEIYAGILDPKTQTEPSFFALEYPSAGAYMPSYQFGVQDNQLYYVANTTKTENAPTFSVCRIELTTKQSTVLMDGYWGMGCSGGFILGDSFYSITREPVNPGLSDLPAYAYSFIHKTNIETGVSQLLHTNIAPHGGGVYDYSFYYCDEWIYFAQDNGGYYQRMPIDGPYEPQPAFEHPEAERLTEIYAMHDMSEFSPHQKQLKGYAYNSFFFDWPDLFYSAEQQKLLPYGDNVATSAADDDAPLCPIKYEKIAKEAREGIEKIKPGNMIMPNGEMLPLIQVNE